MKRRDFVFGGSMALLSIAATSLNSQQGVQSLADPMDPNAHRPVKLPPRPGAAPRLDKEQIKELENGLACPCSCNRTVHNCRLTDPNCQVSPAIHRDVLALVEGGYSADEIMKAFVDVYGERARMSPKAEGLFGLSAYFAPVLAMSAAAILVGFWIMRHLRPREAEVSSPQVTPLGVNATSDELQRIERAMRDDSE